MLHIMSYGSLAALDISLSLSLSLSLPLRLRHVARACDGAMEGPTIPSYAATAAHTTTTVLDIVLSV